MKLPVQSMPVERSPVTTEKANANGVEASDFLNDFTKQFPFMFNSPSIMHPQNILTSFVPLMGGTI